MYTQAAETMWSSLTDKLNDYNHLLELALFGLDNFLQSFQNRKLLHSNFGKNDRIVRLELFRDRGSLLLKF